MKYFNNPKNLEELRKQYLKLMKENHPDNGGTEQATKEINAEYDMLFESLKNIHEGNEKQTKDFDLNIDVALREAINKIIHLEGISIEICGSWVWVTGDTYLVRNELKQAGYKFSKNKKAWYFHTGEFSKWTKRTYSLNYIRAVHGSVPVDSETLLKLA